MLLEKYFFHLFIASGDFNLTYDIVTYVLAYLRLA